MDLEYKVDGLRVNLGAIPNELKECAQWVMWKKEQRNNKWTKIPYQVNGEAAQSNSRDTWSTFDEVSSEFLNNTKYDGVGFMFSKEDEYIGIDIDDCMDGEIVNKFAAEIINLMDSYTEYSPSGTGVHIIVKGELPEHITGTGKKDSKKGLEVYRHGRYFTFTGHRENDNDVFERTDEIEDLFREHFKVQKPIKIDKNSKQIDLTNADLWRKMFNAKNGVSIESLYKGNLINNDHSSSDLSLCNHLAFWTGRNADQMDSMFRESHLFRTKWDKVHFSTGETYGEMTIKQAVEGCQSTILDNENEQYKVHISNNGDDTFVDEETIKELDMFALSEMGNAERIIHKHGQNLYHVKSAGWKVWDNKRWVDDNMSKMEIWTSQTLRELFKGEEVHRKWAKSCERRSVRMSSIKDAEPLKRIDRTEFDYDLNLFNCKNGVIDLRDGKVLPHSRDFLMTQISPVEYDPFATSPVWDSFLESIFKDEQGDVDHELIKYIQKAVGYGLTGEVSEQVMFFFVGGGRNGKSTFINIIQHILGDYARQTNSNTFIKKHNESAVNNDIARLFGSRFVSAVESEEGQQLLESLVKQLTGGEKITARFLNQEFFEFTPQFKIYFTTNHKPIIKGADEGIWRRIKIIPFNVTIPKEDVDKRLSEKLLNELPGIFNWMIRGALMWRKEGLGVAKAVDASTVEYKKEMDLVDPFLETDCFMSLDAKIEAKELYFKYERYCQEYGDFALKNRTFYRILESKGYKKKRGANNKVYIYGIGLEGDRWKYLETIPTVVNEPVTQQNEKNSFSNAENPPQMKMTKL
jgi:putative DNA primase/helicase